ncbi:MAG: cupin domain-containing protein [Candidatus Velthaea sp.]
MEPCNIDDADEDFAVLQTTETAQTAVMDLKPGDDSGEFGNEHPQSEQILFVVSGELLAEIGEERRRLFQGDVVVVPRNTAHRFTNVGDTEARTLNVYVPPAY